MWNNPLSFGNRFEGLKPATLHLSYAALIISCNINTLLVFKFAWTIFRAGLKFALLEFAQQCKKKKTMGPLLRTQ